MKILVTGGKGMVGSAFKNVSTDHELILVGREEADLLEKRSVENLLNDVRPDAVIHLAARVGGVNGNTNYIADFFAQNITMNANVLDSCNQAGVDKVVSLLSTCVYPENARYPLTEDQMHEGEPHVSSFGYSYAKRMLDVHSRALRMQYGRKYICAIPNNLYGPYDNFDLENSHVIPAIIRKVWEAKSSMIPPVFWGDGTPLREFTYSEDIISCLLFLLENYDGVDPVNIGNPGENSIKDIVNRVCELIEYKGKIVWDDKKPSGQFRKPSDNSRFIDLGWDSNNYTSLDEGLRKTIDWFSKSYPDVRGCHDPTKI